MQDYHCPVHQVGTRCCCTRRVAGAWLCSLLFWEGRSDPWYPCRRSQLCAACPYRDPKTCLCGPSHVEAPVSVSIGAVVPSPLAAAAAPPAGGSSITTSFCNL